MKTLVIMCGIPGSGKSTVAKSLAEREDYKLISRDEIRFSMVKEDEDYFSKEKEVIKEYFRQIREALRDPDVSGVIADSTNLTTKARETLIRGVQPPKDTIIRACVMDTPLEECLARNAKREGRLCVPETAIRNMYKGFVDPSEDKNIDYWLIEDVR